MSQKSYYITDILVFIKQTAAPGIPVLALHSSGNIWKAKVISRLQISDIFISSKICDVIVPLKCDLYITMHM